ncbi:MAG: hypothetical protein J6J60_06640 [Clostridia bacterium]|nr:hypothetical protein [Clostridia bacterium]
MHSIVTGGGLSNKRIKNISNGKVILEQYFFKKT